MIRNLVKRESVYLATRHADMRKQVNGLAAIVQGEFGLDPFDGSIFVFMNSGKNKLKALMWDKDGFVLLYKRREKGKFYWPSFEEEKEAVSIDSSDLKRLLDGLIMEKFVPKRSFKVY